MLSKISKDINVSRHFQNISAEFQPTANSPLCFSLPAQLTMEKLCSLKPLHSGLSPAVLRDLQWPEISETAHCQCWRSLLTELRPGHRAMLYNAMHEVTVLSFLSTSLINSLILSLIFSSLPMICCNSYVIVTCRVKDRVEVKRLCQSI